MKKLLFLVNVDWFFLSHRLPIAIAAQKKGYEVHIALGITEHYETLKSYNFVIHKLPITRKRSNIFTELRAFISILILLLKIKPDILHLITIKPVIYGGIAAKFTKTNNLVVAISGLGFVYTSTGLLAKLRVKLINYIYKFALSHPRLIIIFQNRDDQYILNSLVSFKNNQMRIIPGSGVDLTKFSFSVEKESTPIVIMASRLLADKGVKEFLSAAKLLNKKNINVIFYLVGDVDEGNPASIPIKMLNSYKGYESIKILGHQKDIFSLFSKAHIVVLPSYREGFPKVLIEASACGRAIVTTDVPGCRDAIIPNKTGFLVPPRDVKSLADAIEVLIKDKKLRQQMGREGRKLAEEKYSIQQVIKTHLDIYEDLFRKQ